MWRKLAPGGRVTRLPEPLWASQLPQTWRTVYISRSIFGKVTAKWTSSVKEYFFGQKLSPKQPLSKLKVATIASFFPSFFLLRAYRAQGTRLWPFSTQKIGQIYETQSWHGYCVTRLVRSPVFDGRVILLQPDQLFSIQTLWCSLIPRQLDQTFSKSFASRFRFRSLSLCHRKHKKFLARTLRSRKILSSTCWQLR